MDGEQIRKARVLYFLLGYITGRIFPTVERPWILREKAMKMPRNHLRKDESQGPFSSFRKRLRGVFIQISFRFFIHSSFHRQIQDFLCSLCFIYPASKFSLRLLTLLKVLNVKYENNCNQKTIRKK